MEAAEALAFVFTIGPVLGTAFAFAVIEWAEHQQKLNRERYG